MGRRSALLSGAFTLAALQALRRTWSFDTILPHWARSAALRHTVGRLFHGRPPLGHLRGKPTPGQFHLGAMMVGHYADSGGAGNPVGWQTVEVRIAAGRCAVEREQVPACRVSVAMR